MRILVADDDDAMRHALGQLLETDHETVLCGDGDQAFELLKGSAFELVITDQHMPGLTGMELIRQGKALSPTTSFLLITAFGSNEQSVEALRTGADDYLLKPFDFSEVKHRVKQIEDKRLAQAKISIHQEHNKFPFIGDSAAMRSIRSLIGVVAAQSQPVTVIGPLGSGKETVARLIHAASRPGQPFVVVNCSGLEPVPEQIELFGEETQAPARKVLRGKIELAGGGSVFFREPSALSPATQQMLIRLLQEGHFYRRGGIQRVKCAARILIGTREASAAMVAKGKLNEELRLHLGALSLSLPPLRERPEDLPALIDFYWKRYTREIGSHARLLSETEERLRTHSYPGNIRELKLVLQGMALKACESGFIGPLLLPPEFSTGPTGPSPDSKKAA